MVLTIHAWHRLFISQAASGELWDDLVQFSLKEGYWGLENLSMIPGTVGGAAVQNVGAYGTDLGHVLEYVETFNLITGTAITYRLGRIIDWVKSVQG